jgi:hypothetical protein
MQAMLDGSSDWFEKKESPPGALASGLPAEGRSEFTIATEEYERN